MKKALLIFTVLFASVLSTACINNLAIQELNNKAKAYMEAGDVEKAICRYTSSLDLDGNVFETHYNLGVAYVEAKKYNEASEALQNAIKLNPDFAESYYSLGVALEGQAENILNGDDKDSEAEDAENAEPVEVSEADKTKASKLLMDANENYNKYLSLAPDAKDKEQILKHIEEIDREIVKAGTTKADNED